MAKRQSIEFDVTRNGKTKRYVARPEERGFRIYKPDGTTAYQGMIFSFEEICRHLDFIRAGGLAVVTIIEQEKPKKGRKAA